MKNLSNIELLAWYNHYAQRELNEAEYTAFKTFEAEINERQKTAFEPMPFVFADWLEEMGWKEIYYYRKDKAGIFSNAALFIDGNQFSVNINGATLFQECSIPTTRNEAEILFKSFNLL